MIKKDEKLFLCYNSFLLSCRLLIICEAQKISLLLTGKQLWLQICNHLYFELRDCLITFPIFVLSQRLIARNVRELFSLKHEARCIDDVSRGSLSCYQILTNN
jgi:hypothetical protein